MEPTRLGVTHDLRFFPLRGRAQAGEYGFRTSRIKDRAAEVEPGTLGRIPRTEKPEDRETQATGA
ncbi:hypothetical protein ABIA38_008706 [Embleya sp. AB8]